MSVREDRKRWSAERDFLKTTSYRIFLKCANATIAIVIERELTKVSATFTILSLRNSKIFLKITFKFVSYAKTQFISTFLFLRCLPPGQTKKELGPRLYRFTYSNLLNCPNQMLVEMVLSQHWFCHLKPSELVLHMVPDVWGALLGRGLRLVQWCNPRISINFTRIAISSRFHHKPDSNIFLFYYKLHIIFYKFVHCVSCFCLFC